MVFGGLGYWFARWMIQLATFSAHDLATKRDQTPIDEPGERWALLNMWTADEEAASRLWIKIGRVSGIAFCFGFLITSANIVGVFF